MKKQSIDKNLLASRLDDVLPPNTDLILNEDVGEPTVRAAVLLAHQGHRHISSTGRDWAYDRMVATVDDLLDQNHFKSGSGLPTMRLAAGILVIILAGLFATGFLNSMPGRFAQDDPIPSAIQQAQETEAPTEAPTEPPTEEPTEIPTEPPAPPLALAAFVQQDGTVLYSEPNTNAEVVAVLVSGEGVTILGYDASQDWALVQSDSDLAGWIQVELLGDTAPIIVESVQVAPNTQQQAAPAPQPPAPPAGGGGGSNGGPGGNGGPPGGGGGGRGGPGGGGRGGPGGGGGN